MCLHGAHTPTSHKKGNTVLTDVVRAARNWRLASAAYNSVQHAHWQQQCSDDINCWCVQTWQQHELMCIASWCSCNRVQDLKGAAKVRMCAMLQGIHPCMLVAPIADDAFVCIQKDGAAAQLQGIRALKR
jgi:hypothetical protein